ncbi:MAG: molybdopterin-dependent oxidoreductase [Syntrophaceae bacterium]|nr:molybdopterin-dependent oxidoreductase [Syntrophaceae bacterium]
MAKEEKKVTLTIDGVQVSVPPGTMIVEAAAQAGIKIPTLCNNKRLIPFGACRMCVVQQKGRRGFMMACFNPVRNGMDILTHTPEIIKARKIQLQLILISHPLDCPVCDAGGWCDLQNLVYEYGVAENPFKGEKANLPVDHVSPFIERHPNRCILCGMCVRICDEVVGASELSFVNRGMKTRITTDLDRPLNCEFCGQCVSVCPVGALNDRIFLHKARVWDLKETSTVCAYCGVGCTLLLGAKNDRVLRVRADEDRGLNQGNLCVKGRFGWEYIHSPKRLTSPLIRKNGELIKATWEEALVFAARRLKEIQGERGGSALAGLASPRLTNEELYLFQKFCRGVLGTNHIDHAGGYSYTAHLALKNSLGHAASTNSINEVRQADVILVLRSDLSETHPVVKSEVVLAAKRRKAKVIVVNSRDIYLKKFSTLTLRVKPGSEAALVNGMAAVILKEGLAQEEFLQSRTQGLEALKNSLESIPPGKIEALTGVAADSLAEAARQYAKAKTGVILISTGQNSGQEDPAIAQAAVNLALLTGKIGRESCGIFVLGEKNNSQGALDMGVTPRLLPGYADLHDASERSRFERAWGLTIPDQPGKGALEILQGIEEGKVRGLYVAGENPAVTYPDSERTQKALSSLDFLVVQDCFLSETALLAHVVFPAVTFAEKEGTFTNSDRRVQRVRPALPPLEEALPDLAIFQDLALAMGTSLGPTSVREVNDEVRSLVKLYGGISLARLDSPDLPAGIQWPCLTAEHPGTPILYEKEFPVGKARLIFSEYHEEGGKEADSSFALAVGPTLFHSGSLSLLSPGLSRLQGDGFVLVHPSDAKNLVLKEGETVTLESPRGRIRVKVSISPKTSPGVLFVPGHFAENGGNRLTGWDLKTTRVQLEKR